MNTCEKCKFSRHPGNWKLTVPPEHLLCAHKPPSVFVVPVVEQNPLDPRDVRQALSVQTACPVVPFSHCCGEFERYP